MKANIDTAPDGASVSWPSDGAQARVFSGHESFVCRPGWLPKIYEAVRDDADLFESDERAILALGLGRNMVKSLRFWGDAFGVTAHDRGRTTTTPFARLLLDGGTGLDPYLEEHGSLWRLHWQLATRACLGAWVVGLLENPDAEVPKDRLVELVKTRASAGRKPITMGTAAAHVDIFIRTYDAARLDGAILAEDSLGCQHQELGLLELVTRAGTSLVKFRRGAKAGLDMPTFAFAVADFWRGTAAGSRTLSIRSLLLERRSPGNVFRLDEPALYDQLEALCCAAPSLSLSDDGAGGTNLVAGDAHFLSIIEDLAWPNR